jgi:hypothetical protein
MAESDPFSLVCERVVRDWDTDRFLIKDVSAIRATCCYPGRQAFWSVRERPLQSLVNHLIGRKGHDHLIQKAEDLLTFFFAIVQQYRLCVHLHQA